MAECGIYEDIARRTGGSIYLGVVGPVRTGKSTFIKRFMETLVLPGIGDAYMRERARDELPQSGSGRTVMTAEPKFVPEEPVALELGNGISVGVRLVDCVGYMVPGAAGQFEGDGERMVTTPWFDHEIPMSAAAEQGTRKVITEHSTIGLMVTTDGSITDIPREDYIQAEGRVISELREMGRPFVVLLNCAEPDSAAAVALAEALEEQHGVTVLRVNCLTLGADAMTDILRSALCEFPAGDIRITLPSWVEALPSGSPLKASLYEAILDAARDMRRIKDIAPALERLSGDENISLARVTAMDLGNGTTDAEIELPRETYYNTVSEQSGFDIRDDGDLMGLLAQLGQLKSAYAQVADAMEQVRESGYGVVMPAQDEMSLDEPRIVRSGGRYSVKLKASAPAIHLIRTDIVTEVSPALGGEGVSDEIVSFLLQGCEGDASRLWESNIFGRSLYEIAADGLEAKVRALPVSARSKLRDTLGRIVNDGCGGLICIIL